MYEKNLCPKAVSPTSNSRMMRTMHPSKHLHYYE